MPRVPTRVAKKVRERYKLERNTFSVDKVPHPKRLHSIEIGDSKQDDFYPQAKFTGWGNEVNLSLRLVDDFNGTVRTEGDKVVYENGPRSARFYEIDDSDFEDGAFEFDIVLTERPLYPELTFTVKAKGLKAYFQPALTQEEIDEGVSRPERFVNSWAIYHATKKNNRLLEVAENKFSSLEIAQGVAEGWIVQKELSKPRKMPDGTEVTEVTYELDGDVKAGKLAHIPRPHYTDANGNKVWCEFELPVDEENNIIDGGTARLLLPDEHTGAAYPIVVDPTFGYTSVGGSATFGSIQGSLYAIRYVLGENGDVSKLDFYTYAGGSGRQVKGLIYDDNSNYPNSLETPSGDSTSIPNGILNADWVTLSFSSSLGLTSGTYWLGWVTTGGSVYYYYDTGSANQRYFTSNSSYFVTPPTSFPGGASGNAREVSIYATYTASGGGSPRRIFNIS